MLVVVSGVTVFLIADTVSAQTGGGGAAVNPRNYTLVQDSFEFRDSPYILTLQFRGAPIVTNTVGWHVSGLPSGVISATVKRVNGQNVLEFIGSAPRPEHAINIVATVMQADRQLASVQFTVSILASGNTAG